MKKDYRVVRLDSRSIYGQVPVTPWLTHGEAAAYLRYANRVRVGSFAMVSRRGVIQKIS